MRIRAFCSLFLGLSLCAALPRPAASQATTTFNFDNGTPAVLTGQLVPLDQTVAGLTASFTSPNGPVYLVQSEASTGNRLTQFSGNYLGDHDVVRSTLSIRFNQSLTSISLTFATSDTTIEVPSLIQLTAYLNSTAPPAVGTISTRGTYAPGVNTWPMGTLTFDSGGQPFNLVEINLPFAPTGATSFFVDNIRVTTSAVQTRTLYTSEAAYLAAAGSAGYSTSAEGFEDGAAWGAVRSPNTAARIVNNGVIWTSNHINTSAAPDGISTSGGAGAHGGSWGGISLPHGNPDAALPTNLSLDGVVGTRVPGNGLLYGAGFWISGSAGGRFAVIIDGDEQHPIDAGTLTTAWQFFGVTIPAGFSTFELRETQGVVSEQRYVYVDDVTLASKLPVTSIANVSAASFRLLAPLARGAIGSSFGSGLATATQAAAAFPLPVTLGGATLTLKDSGGAELPVSLYYASPTQTNFVVPDTAALGAGTLLVKIGGQVVASGPVVIAAVAPSLFTANMSGTGVPVAISETTLGGSAPTLQAVFSCGAAAGSCVPSQIDVSPAVGQVALRLYGTGIRGFSALAGLSATVGGVAVPVQQAGAVAGAAGLDQVLVGLPATLAGRGEVDLLLKVDGKPANSVRVNLK